MLNKIISSCILVCFPYLLISSETLEQRLAGMSLDEKIGQLFIAAAYSSLSDAQIEGQTDYSIASVEALIRDYHVGGLLFKRSWDPLQQVHYVRHFQSLSKIPLLITQDCEWGLAMRLSNTIAFPRNMTLGAIQDDQLLYNLGREIGRQCRLVGVNINFAPVVDVNSNPANPVIGFRSFGDDPIAVARKGVMLMKGIQEEGVIACAKHFPGHGDTQVDSHYNLPTVMHDREYLDRVELYPFRKMIEAGVRAVMTAHVVMPALDTLPATLSPAILRGLLRSTYEFQGLIVTDDLMMKAIADRYSYGEAAVMAYQAGADLLLSSQDIPICIQRLKEGFLKGALSLEVLDQRVLKILKAKDWIASRAPVSMLSESSPGCELQNPEALALKKQLYREALTLLGTLPTLDDKTVCLQMGGENSSPFYATLAREADITRTYLGFAASAQEVSRAISQPHSHLIIALYPKGMKATDNFGLTPEVLSALQACRDESATLIIFGSPYLIPLIGHKQPIVMAYEADPDAQIAAADLLLGKIRAPGRLPIRMPE